MPQSLRSVEAHDHHVPTGEAAHDERLKQTLQRRGYPGGVQTDY